MFQNFTLEEYDLLVITFIYDCLSCRPCVQVSGVDKAECFSDIMTMHCYGASGILQMSVELCWTNLCLKGQQIWSGYNITCIFSSARYGLSASSDLSQYIGPTKERKVPNLQFWSPWRKFIVYHSSCDLFYDRYSKPDFFYIKSWVPCIFFSGGVTIGTIGRALAMVSWDYIPVDIGSYNIPTS